MPIFYFLYIFVHGNIIGFYTLGVKNVECGNYRFYLKFDPGLCVLGFLFILYLLYSLRIAKKGLDRKGLNKEVRQVVKKRQYIFIIVMIFSTGLYSILKTHAYFGKEANIR